MRAHLLLCFLYASKAISLINHETIFNRLLEKNLPVHFTSFFLAWYKDEHMCPVEEFFSDGFSVSNGV